MSSSVEYATSHVLSIFSSPRDETFASFLRWSGITASKSSVSHALTLSGAIARSINEGYCADPAQFISFWFEASNAFAKTHGVDENVCAFADALLELCFAAHRSHPMQGLNLAGRESLGDLREMEIAERFDTLQKYPWLLFEVTLFHAASQKESWAAAGRAGEGEVDWTGPCAAVLCAEYLLEAEAESAVVVLFWQLLFCLLFFRAEGEVVGFRAMDAVRPGLLNQLGESLSD